MVIDNSKDTNLQKVYTSKDGTDFYSFANPLSIPTSRGLAAEKAKRFVDMRLTERSLKELIRQCKTEAGLGDVVKAFSIVQEIEYRLEFLTEESSLLDLACIYFMLNDEDPENPTDVINKKKHAIFYSDQKAKGFFLSVALTIVKKFSQNHEEDSLTYLEENQVMSERIRRYIAEEHLIPSING